MYPDPSHPLIFLQVSDASALFLSLKSQVMKHFSGDTDVRDGAESASSGGWRRSLPPEIARIKAEPLHAPV